MEVVDKPVDRVLTIRQRLFAEARVLGLSMTDAAIKAGCPEKSARKAGSRLDKHPAVKAAIARLEAAKADPRSVPPEEVTTDPKEHLQAILKNPLADPKLKLEAAKALLPYVHKKLGDQGKKEQQQERAGEVAGRGRFGPQQPPTLRAVK